MQPLYEYPIKVQTHVHREAPFLGIVKVELCVLLTFTIRNNYNTTQFECINFYTDHSQSEISVSSSFVLRDLYVIYNFHSIQTSRPLSVKCEHLIPF